jgi:hypothetical protein
MRRGLAGGLVSLAVLGVVAAPAAAAPERTVQPVRSVAPDAKQVKESYVSLLAPLPEEVGPHPAACDRLGYLRFRHRDGPRKSRKADAVLVAMPGFLGGAADFDQVGRNVVRNAARRNRHVEFWGLDRRANCLEDHTGVHAGARAQDGAVAIDYYWRGAEVDGRRFAGFKTASEAEFLKHFGVDRTVRDWYAVIRRELPFRYRKRRLVCGGHSLGGPLTNLFASWDFDGDPATRRDAGFRQCAGFFGLDTSFSFTDAAAGVPGVGSMSDVVAQSGASPFVNLGALGPETFQVPSVFAVGGYFDPTSTDLNAILPRTPNIDLAERFLFSRDAAAFAAGPHIRDFEITNRLAFAGILDDNSAPLSFLRASLGFGTGGPFADKNFPSPGDGTMAVPAEPEGFVYGWQNYRAVGAGGAPVPLNESGEPYTSRDSEITDSRQLARTMFEAPADFIEQYFPTRILVDVVAADSGGEDDFPNRLYDGVGERPALLVQAGDSDSNSNSGGGEGGFAAGEPPNSNPLSREVILPEYNHLDVATAARRQNNGKPERSSKALTRFALAATRRAR